MEPELYFFEEWLRQRDADLRAAARAGWMGALVAGVCFVVPGFVVMLTLTLLYTTFAAVASPIAMAVPQVGIVTVVLIAGSVAIMLYASRAWGAVLVAATLALALLLALKGVFVPAGAGHAAGAGPPEIVLTAEDPTPEWTQKLGQAPTISASHSN